MKTPLAHRLSWIAPALALLVSLGAPALADEAPAGWTPYLQDKDGDKEAFPANTGELKDKDWLKVRYTDFVGFKPRLAVVVSEEKDGASAGYTDEWVRLLSSLYGEGQPGTNPLNHIEDLVGEALGATNRFTMLERTTATDDMIEEQDFGQSGRVDGKSAAAVGKIKGADYLVKATIVEINPEKDTKDIKAVGGAITNNALGIGSVGISGKVAFCRLNVRIFNSSTSEILQNLTVDGTASSKGLSVGGIAGKAGSHVLGGIGASSNSKKEAPLSDALQSCANKIAYAVSQKFEELPWQGSVASINEANVMINAGTNVGLQSELTLKLLSKGEEIFDPDTNESLGFDLSEIGTIQIVSVQERFSTCQIISIKDGKEAKKGDVVILNKVAH